LILELLSDGSIGLLCRFLQDSSAQVSDTFANVINTSINPEDVDLEHLFIAAGLSSTSTDALEYELCSMEPLLAIHTTIGGTTEPEPGTYIHEFGDDVNVSALPDSGAEFTGWSGDESGTISPIIITLDSDKAVTANFVIHQYTLSISAGEGGTTNPAPGPHLYDSQTEVRVEAIPESDYRFSEWSEDIRGTINPISVMMDSNKSIKANFVQVGDESDDNTLDKIFRVNCFIATAAYGSPLHPHVKILQDFRDKYLIQNKYGRMSVDLYYKYSPKFADFISKHKFLKVLVRFYLLPFVVFSYSMVKFGPICTALIFLVIFLIPLIFIIYRERQRA
jgi:hypothetical protein